MRNAKLSKNFYLDEFLISDTAERLKISNTPSTVHAANLRTLVQDLLQPLRTKLACPIEITSGYRSRALNTYTGGSKTSQHSLGEAADFKVWGMSMKDVLEIIRNEFEYDQLISEFPDATGEPSWIHVSYKSIGNRKQYLIAYKDEHGKTKYKNG